MKRALLIMMILVAAGAAFLVYREFNRTTESLSTDKAALASTATALISQYAKDTAAAQKTYSDQVMDVSGRIKKIAADGNPVVIFLGDASEMSSVQCSMDSTDAKSYVGLHTGDSTTLKGRVTGFRTDPLFGTDVILNRCVVVQSR